MSTRSSRRGRKGESFYIFSFSFFKMGKKCLLSDRPTDGQTDSLRHPHIHRGREGARRGKGGRGGRGGEGGEGGWF